MGLAREYVLKMRLESQENKLRKTECNSSPKEKETTRNLFIVHQIGDEGEIAILSCPSMAQSEDGAWTFFISLATVD